MNKLQDSPQKTLPLEESLAKFIKTLSNFALRKKIYNTLLPLLQNLTTLREDMYKENNKNTGAREKRTNNMILFR